MPRRHRTKVPQPANQPINEANEAVSANQSTNQPSSQSKPSSSKQAQSKPAASKATSAKPSQSTSRSTSQSSTQSSFPGGFQQAAQVGSRTLWMNKDMIENNPEEVARMMERVMRPGKSEFQLFCDANHDQVTREMGPNAQPIEIMQMLGMRFNMQQLAKR